MLLLNINGPINAGKSTVCRILQQKLSEARFVEVDDLLSDKEQQELNLDFWGGIFERLNRLDEVIAEAKESNACNILLFAYPLGGGDGSNYTRWKQFEDEKTKLICITLAPALDKCLSNRGTRELKDWEKARIKEMYELGYQNPPQADLIIDNSSQTPNETAELICSYLSGEKL